MIDEKENGGANRKHSNNKENLVKITRSREPIKLSRKSYSGRLSIRVDNGKNETEKKIYLPLTQVIMHENCQESSVPIHRKLNKLKRQKLRAKILTIKQMNPEPVPEKTSNEEPEKDFIAYNYRRPKKDLIRC